MHIYQNFFIVLNSHAYVDKKTIVIFIKETTNVKEAFPTVKLSSPKQKITAMNGITIVEFQLMWIDIMHLHKLLNIAVQISEHTRTIAKVTDKKLLTSKPLAPSPCDMQKVLKYVAQTEVEISFHVTLWLAGEPKYRAKQTKSVVCRTVFRHQLCLNKLLRYYFP